VEQVEEKFLLSTLAGLDVAPAAAPASRQRAASSFSLMPVSYALPSPSGRVQAGGAGLFEGSTYGAMAVLEVLNQTGTTIGVDRFRVGVPGSGQTHRFPQAAWRPGTVLAFFAPLRAGSFEYQLGGAPIAIPPNVYSNVTYYSRTFNTTLHALINSSYGVGGRFTLV
jgi:hypothetical protein